MRGPMRRRGRLLDVVGVVGFVALGALTWYVHVVTPDGADPWLFRGGFLITGLATVAVIAAVTHRGTAAGPALGNAVLVWIGMRSYGLYLYHWPIFQGIRRVAGNALTVPEFLVGWPPPSSSPSVSYRVIETPIRRGTFGRWWRRLQLSGTDGARRIVAGAGGARRGADRVRRGERGARRPLRAERDRHRPGRGCRSSSATRSPRRPRQSGRAPRPRDVRRRHAGRRRSGRRRRPSTSTTAVSTSTDGRAGVDDHRTDDDGPAHDRGRSTGPAPAATCAAGRSVRDDPDRPLCRRRLGHARGGRQPRRGGVLRRRRRVPGVRQRARPGDPAARRRPARQHGRRQPRHQRAASGPRTSTA